MKLDFLAPDQQASSLVSRNFYKTVSTFCEYFCAVSRPTLRLERSFRPIQGMASASDKDEVSEAENPTATDETRPIREYSEGNSMTDKSPVKEDETRSHPSTSTHRASHTVIDCKKSLREPESLTQTQVKQMPKEQRKIRTRAGKIFHQPKAGRIAVVAAQILRLAPVIVGEVGSHLHPNLNQINHLNQNVQKALQTEEGKQSQRELISMLKKLSHTRGLNPLASLEWLSGSYHLPSLTISTNSSQASLMMLHWRNVSQPTIQCT